jgi:peptidoglycan hydrolase-like protein with peptidoglycan-binding domain
MENAVLRSCSGTSVSGIEKPPSLKARLLRVVIALTMTVPVMGTVVGVASAAGPEEQRSFPDCPLLLEGQQSDCVVKLQHYLNAVNSAYGLPEDGSFGPGTRIAVLDFQGRNHLPADGNVGGATADALTEQAGAISPPAPAPAPAPTSDPAPALPANHGKDSVEHDGSTYYSHAATVEMDKKFSTYDRGPLTCEVIEKLFPVSEQVAGVACAALKFGSGNVAHIVHHAATTNACARFQHLLPGGMGPVYADRGDTCRSMD